MKSKSEMKRIAIENIHAMVERSYELQKRLAEAEEVIRFYGDKQGWVCVDHGLDCKNPESVITVCDQGRHARDYFNKHKEKK